MLPRSLYIDALTLSAEGQPRGYGGFSDVFIGTFAKQEVAIKKLRIPQEEGISAVKCPDISVHPSNLHRYAESLS
jgi:hypothetical protein